jgi:hypothetical protein
MLVLGRAVEALHDAVGLGCVVARSDVTQLGPGRPVMKWRMSALLKAGPLSVTMTRGSSSGGDVIVRLEISDQP